MNGEMSIPSFYRGKGGTQMTKDRVGMSSKELWKPNAVFLTLSLFVDLFLFQCRPNQIWHEQTLSAEVDGVTVL